MSEFSWAGALAGMMAGAMYAVYKRIQWYYRWNYAEPVEPDQDVIWEVD